MTDFRPHYHYSVPEGWMNDPNGLLYADGEWHLFYQHTPAGKKGQYWGHAVSRDLLTWEDLPVALAPDALGNIWSGSAVWDANNTSGFFDGAGGMVAIFTHQKPESQSQSIAYSRDQGRTWRMYDGNPVMTDPSPDFRDPKVFWHEPTGRWTMLVTARDEMRFYTSPNLREWEYVSSFAGVGMEGVEGVVWECPDLFPLPRLADDGTPTGETDWVLTASVFSKSELPVGFGRQTTYYYVGAFDGITFTPDSQTSQLLDFGPDNYAAIVWTDAPDGRRILLGWMNRWSYSKAVPTGDWLGAMTLPRELSLRQIAPGLRLVQTPLPKLAQLRRHKREWGKQTSTDTAQILCEDSGDAFETEVIWRPETARESGLKVRVGGGQETVIGYDATTGELFVDRTRSGQTDFHPDFPARYTVPLTPEKGAISLRIYGDRCSVEVFTTGGEVVTCLLFPDPSARGITFYADGGTATLESLALYELAG